MFSESAELYDMIYASFKDYRDEAERLVALLARVAPGARTVLDVGCGTGEHAKRLVEDFGFEVDGLDIDENLLAVARAKNPGLAFFQGDMSSFHLGRRYDVVMSLFSSIGYVQTLERVRDTLVCFREHLNPGGHVVVEPWFTPQQWTRGRVDSQTVKKDGVEVVRMSHSDARDRVSIVTFEYLIGAATGLTRRHEIHELGLFTKDEMLESFDSAGLVATYDPVGLMGRGLYIAVNSRATDISA